MGAKDSYKRTIIQSPTQLLVEGKDDKNFFESLIQHLNLSGIQIHSFDGIRKLPTVLSGLIKEREFEVVRSIGIIRDADDDMESAWRSVKSALENKDLPVPKRVRQKSDNKPTAGKPAASVFILPDNKSPGMLETLLCKSFEEKSTNGCISDFFQCLESKPSDNKIYKARAHVYIATQPTPHVSVGVAGQKGYWDFNHPAFTELKAFLENLTPNK